MGQIRGLMGAARWRESRLLLIVAGLAVLATAPATLAAFKVTDRWVVSAATGIAAMLVVDRSCVAGAL